MYKYTQTEFVAMMDELMDKFKKGCQKSDAELEAAYKILNPAPVGGFIDSLVKMDKYYGTDLWEIKRKQIKCFISKCDRYEMDDIVAYCRAKFFKDEINRIIYDKSIAEECDVCIFADSTIIKSGMAIFMCKGVCQHYMDRRRQNQLYPYFSIRGWIHVISDRRLPGR